MKRKRCAQCRLELPISAFFPRGKERPGQFQSRCKSCMVAYKRRWRLPRREPGGRPWARIENRAPKGRKWCVRCGVTKALSEFHLRRDRPVGRVAYCKPCWNGLRQAFGTSERGRVLVREWASVRRARKRRTQIRPVRFVAIYERDRGRCWICDRELPFESVHFDHVIPLVRNGTHTEDNIRVACQPCNDRKRDKLMTPELRASIRAAVLKSVPPH